jgi:hypothetical protein
MMQEIAGRNRARRALSFGVFTLMALAASAGAAENALEAELRATLEAHRRALTVDAEGLHGAGGAWLVERAREARFTLIGESHNNAETPLLTRGLLAALRPAGYGTYVVECGPESTRLLVEALASGGVEAGEALLTRFPFSIPFLDRREELQTAAAALSMGYEVQGADQEFMGSPRLLLHRLAELSADDDFRERMRRMVEREVAAFERLTSSGDQSEAFLLTATDDDFAALAAAFPGTVGEGARIVEQLRSSAGIYRAYAEQRYYDNNATRVELIKRNFLAGPGGGREAQSADRRALIKMGSVHAGRGRTPMQVYDIGNFAAEMAFAEGGVSFHVLVLATGSVGADGELTGWSTRAPYLVPLLDLAAEKQPVVFDLAPLRPLLTQRGGKSEELEELQEVALRYDALVLFPRFHPSAAIVPWPGG